MGSEIYINEEPLFLDPFSLFLFDETIKNLSLPSFDVKTEEKLSFCSSNNCCSENYSFTPCFESFDPVIEVNNFQPQNSENGNFSMGSMRRVCSTGDLQTINGIENHHQLSSSLITRSNSYIEEANIKVGRYNADEKKERIQRYKAKRMQRNFRKTIKYACRKTLADSRPRIRGRFARHDEPEESSISATSCSYEDEYGLWIDGFNVEEEERIMVEGSLFNILGPSQFKYCDY